MPCCALQLLLIRNPGLPLTLSLLRLRESFVCLFVFVFYFNTLTSNNGQAIYFSGELV